MELTLGQFVDWLFKYFPADEAMELEQLMDLPIVFQSLDEADMNCLNIYMDNGKISIDVGND